MNLQKYFLFCIAAFLAPSASAQNWEPVTNAEELRSLFIDTVHTGVLAGGSRGVARFNADGSGVLEAWGAKFDRKWKVEDGQALLLIDGQWLRLKVERNAETESEYRATRLDTGEKAVFRVEGKTISVEETTSGGQGGDVAASAEEIAKQLANPNTPLATLNLKFQQRWFEGDLPGADSESGSTLIFQPSLPFSLKNGDLVFFRPAIPLQLSSPFFDASDMDFDQEDGLGDIGFDLAYGRTLKNGIVLAGGMIATVPTATSKELGSGQFSAGPEFLITKLGKKYVVGAFPNHQWDIGGWSGNTVNLTSSQLFATYLPGGGWNLGSSPSMSYDWHNDQWTIPLNFTFGKTVIRKGRPWKLSMEINYYVEQADAFGPQWFVGFNIGPVVKNMVAEWFER
jgi:hypothetical protein